MQSIIKQRIAALLEKEGIGKAALAEKVGISKQAVGNWSKTGKISVENIAKLAEIYKDLNIRWLLGEDVPMNVNSYRTEDQLSMWGEAELCAECMRKQGVIDNLKETIKEKEQRIEELLTHKDCGNNKKAC